MTISAALYLCAIGLSSIAAYYSIIGLAAIFAASFWPVVLMASVLEISKLVVASWLYRNWTTAGAIIKTYLTLAVVILMCITSLGIFGFLSKAHVDQGMDTTRNSHKLELINSEIAQLESVAKRYDSQLSQLDRAINQQLDANRSTQALNLRKQQETERKEIRTKLDNIQVNLQDLKKQKTELKNQSAMLDSKLGALKYVAELFVDAQHVDTEKTVRWMIIAIVMVFDPLAILMLIAAMKNDKHTLHSTQHTVTLPDAPPLAPTQSKHVTLDATGHHKHEAWQNLDGNLIIHTHKGWQHLNTGQPRATLRDMQPTQKPDAFSHVVVHKQEMDLSQIQKHVEESLDKWLDKNVNVVQPPDITLVKDMVQEIIGKNQHNLDKKSAQ